jgi:glycosyltransferase involved in cell wall biosynthesis
MKYSIITASYNAACFIERALLSILNQSYPNFEWLVQDGGSTDDTLSILAKYHDQRIKLQSAPDSGIYDAWNKAVARATGDWAIFLGTDDMFISTDALAKCHRHLKRMGREIDFAYAAMVRGQNLEIREVNNLSLFEVYHRFNNRLGPPMPSMFIKTSLLRKAPFDGEHYKIVGDFDFVARFYTADNIARIPVMAVYMEQGGISTDAEHRDLLIKETCQVLRKRILPKATEMMQSCIKHYFDRDDTLEE